MVNVLSLKGSDAISTFSIPGSLFFQPSEPDWMNFTRGQGEVKLIVVAFSEKNETLEEQLRQYSGGETGDDLPDFEDFIGYLMREDLQEMDVYVFPIDVIE